VRKKLISRQLITNQKRLKINGNKLYLTNTDRLTHAYVQLAIYVHLAGFAPAFTLSFHDSERSRKPPNAHSLGR
jgi:hypothetical protein